MGTTYRKAYTMPLPAGAEFFERDGVRMARWKLRSGRTRTAEVVPESRGGEIRVRGLSRYYMVRFRDGHGQVIEVRTNCRDEVAARAVLVQLERRAELVRAGVITEAEDNSAGHARLPLARHLDAYENHLRAKGGAARRIKMVRARLKRLASACGFGRLGQLAAGPLEEWLVERADEGMSAATRNGYREAAICFANWCRRTRRLIQNPFLDVPRANPRVDRKHERRALTTAEIDRLLKIARWRPLAEYGREVLPSAREEERDPKSRATWTRRSLTIDNIDAAVERAREALAENPTFLAALERKGRERELIYKTLVLSGLRKGELASLTVAQLELDGPVPYAVLKPADEKNRNGSNIVLRADLARELKNWMDDRLARLQDECRAWGEAIPSRLPGTTPVFDIPSGLARILDRDLAAAGIPKRDERNRVVDVHAFRTSFGTHLCAAGVPLRTAQAAMRHSKPELTANVYTDPKLLDVAGAIEALRVLPPDDQRVRRAN